MKSRTAAKGRKLLFLAAVCLASALLLSPTAEASRGVPTAALSLEPPVAHPGSEAPPAPQLDIFHLEDDLLLELLTGVEPEHHQALLEHRRLELISTSAIQKTASGVSTSDLELNVQKGKPLKPDLRWTVPFYAKARFYDPEVGRFLTEDPAEPDLTTPPSLHKYLYAYGNPTRWWDPFGLQSVEIDDDDYDRWRNTHPDGSMAEYFDWIDERYDAAAAQREADRSSSWWSILAETTSETIDDLFLKRWRKRSKDFSEKRQQAKLVEEETDELRASYTNVEDDRALAAHQTGRRTGTGKQAQAYATVVVAGVTTAVVIADDVSMLTGAGALAKHGIKEGMQVAIKKSDGGVDLFKVVDGEPVRQALDEVAERSIRSQIDETPITNPNRLLGPGNQASSTRQQVSRTRGTGVDRGKAHEAHNLELFGGRDQVSVDTPLGRRFQDVGEIPIPGGGLMTVEAKNYRLWRQLKGAESASRQEVGMTDFIRNQIHKDVLWRRAGKGQQRIIQWDFAGAPPSAELRTVLSRWNINIIEDVP